MMSKKNKAKALLIPVIALLVLISNGSTPDIGEFNTTTSKTSQDSSLKINSLPFGCSTIYKHNFPSELKPPKVSFTDSGKKYTSKNLYKSIRFFDKYCSKNAVRLQRSIENIEYFQFSTKNENKLNDSLLKLIDSVRFRLPNIGNHQVYFSTGCHLFSRVKNWRKRYDSNPNWALKSENSGNLIIYNPTNKNAKVINLYRYMSGGYVAQYYRLFYIKNYKNIFTKSFSITETKAIANERKTISLKHNKSENTVDVVVQ